MKNLSGNKLWLFIFPLLFIPNLGGGIDTSYGGLEISDFLVVVFLALITIQNVSDGRARGWLFMHQMTPVVIVFVWWGFLVTLLIPLRYDYFANSQMWFAVLKLAKFVLYIAAGLSIARFLQNEKSRHAFHWSLLGAGTIISLSLILNNQQPTLFATYAELFEQLYIDNLISVSLAMLICYMGGNLVSGYGSVLFRRSAAISILIMMIGIFSTSGRGGWIALIAGVLYIVYRRQSRRTFGFALLAILAVLYAYTFIPSFEYEVNRTLLPDEAQLAHLERYNAGVAGYDDGKRLTIWVNEGKKFLGSPILGTGFYHRGGQTGLHPTGSHNFFLQMFLETGIIGGALMIALFGLMWKQAGSHGGKVRQTAFEVPFKACLVAAVAGGLGGEYFYGGQALLLLFAIYAVIGSFELTADANDVLSFRRKLLGMPSGGMYESGFATLKKGR